LTVVERVCSRVLGVKALKLKTLHFAAFPPEFTNPKI
ncbi:hypothetical protein BVRB_036980, partial [Beta vulgaris subsp. vulgaris]